MTYSISRIDNTLLRTRRQKAGVYTTPMAINMLFKFGPNAEVIARASIIPGNPQESNQAEIRSSVAGKDKLLLQWRVNTAQLKQANPISKGQSGRTKKR